MQDLRWEHRTEMKDENMLRAVCSLASPAGADLVPTLQMGH